MYVTTLPWMHEHGHARGVCVRAQEDDLSFFERREGEGAVEYAARVFTRMYAHDIARLAAISDMWEKRSPPAPLALADVLPDTAQELAALKASGAACARPCTHACAECFRRTFRDAPTQQL